MTWVVSFPSLRQSAQAYFEEAVPGSQIESKRIRKCMLYYYLEDDCLQVFEPAEENSGLPQGCLVRRHRVPKPDGSYYGMSDLQIGAVIDVYRKMIHIYDCDDFTRRTLTERGLPVSNRLPSRAVSLLPLTPSMRRRVDGAGLTPSTRPRDAMPTQVPNKTAAPGLHLRRRPDRRHA